MGQFNGSNISIINNDLLVRNNKIETYGLYSASATTLNYGTLLKFRSLGTKATGTVTLSFSAASGGEIIPKGTLVSTSTPDIMFETTQSYVLSSSDTSVDCHIQAVNYGTVSNVANATITTLVSSVPDITVTGVTNGSATTGGVNGITDEMLAWDGHSGDDVNLIEGILYNSIDEAAGTFVCDVVVAGDINKSAVDLSSGTIGAVPISEISDRLRQLGIFLVGLE